jgi:hypothetical protein
MVSYFAYWNLDLVRVLTMNPYEHFYVNSFHFELSQEITQVQVAQALPQDPVIQLAQPCCLCMKTHYVH